MKAEYRFASTFDKLRVAEELGDLCSTAGILIVDARRHGIISAKIASTVHDTFHALILAALNRYGKTTPELFENLNLRLAQSVTARNALGMKPFGTKVKKVGSTTNTLCREAHGVTRPNPPPHPGFTRRIQASAEPSAKDASTHAIQDPR